MEITNKKVLHILDHSVPYRDGYATRAQQIVSHQKVMGYTPIAVTSDRHEPDIVRECEFIDDIPYYRTKKGSLLSKIPFIRDIRTVVTLSSAIKRVVKAEKPDILHAHSSVLNGYAALRIARSYKIPLIYEIRALWEDAAVDQGKMTENSMKYNLIRFLETGLVQKVDKVVVISEHLKKDFEQRGIKNQNFYVVPNGVDVSKFQVQYNKDAQLLNELGLQDKVVFGFIGSFYHFEGLEFLIKAFADLQGEQFVLLLVGSGERFESIKRLVASLGLQHKILLPGRVEHDQVSRYYSVMDVLVYPRLSMRITELVTPLKPLEAMAMGKCVLASDVGGHLELIKKAGIFFVREDYFSLKEKLEMLGNNEELRWIYVKKAREYIEKKRSWDNNIELYRKIYEN